MGSVPDSVPYPNTNYKYFFEKIDTAGNFISFHEGFDSTGGIENFSRGLDVIDDNRFLFTSWDFNYFLTDPFTLTVFKIVDSTGRIIHKNTIKRQIHGGYLPNSVLILKNGFIMCTGIAYLSTSRQNLAIFESRLDTTLYIDPVGIITQNNNIPVQFKLYQNYPNPFNPVTRIKFEVPPLNPPLVKGGNGSETHRGEGMIALKVYDLLGKEIETLVNEKLQPGSYEVKFDASSYPSGVYFYRLIGDGYAETRKMILLK
jgi:hypothetical protein